MQLIPAIDLREGGVVRLLRGDDAARTRYETKPLEALRRYRAAGVRRVHVVDLDAAFGEDQQRSLIESLLRDSGDLEIQLGGGLRDAESARWALEAGCFRLVMTSFIVKDFNAFARLVEQYPGRIVAALDMEEGRLKHGGWRDAWDDDVGKLCTRLAGLPLGAVLVTDIARDGAMSGPNVALAVEIAGACQTAAIVSGGVRALDDVLGACREPSVEGVVVGRALYDGAIDLDTAVAACRALAQEEEAS